MLSVLSTRVLEAIVKPDVPWFARVIEPVVKLGQAIDPHEVLVFQLALQRFEVLGNPLLMAAFGNHAGAPTHAPHQSDLRRRAVTLLSNGGNDFVLEQGVNSLQKPYELAQLLAIIERGFEIGEAP